MSTSHSYKRVAILGLGLIGSSVARAMTEKGLVEHIAAYNHTDYALKYALKHGFITSLHKEAGEAVKEAELIILATPPYAFAELMRSIAPALKSGAVITDVGSVKQSAIAAIKPCLPEGVHYVPAHPIAGSEKTGVEAGNAGLFTGKKVILTPDETELMGKPVEFVRAFWERIGAKVEFMPAHLHDLIYAYVSHLPQMVAFAIAPLVDDTLTDEKYKRFTRLTKSDAALWAEIYLENAVSVGHAMDDFIRFSTQIHGELKGSAQEEHGHSDANLSMLFAGLVAACLIATASLLQEQAGVNPVRYAGMGFADMTAASVADPQELLADISANNTKIAPMLGQMINRLQSISSALTQGNKQVLADVLKS